MLLLFCRAEARVKGVFFTDAGIHNGNNDNDNDNNNTNDDTTTTTTTTTTTSTTTSTSTTTTTTTTADLNDNNDFAPSARIDDQAETFESAYGLRR